MSPVVQLLIVVASVFGVNLIPAFAPPTWALLIYFRIAFGLPVAVLAVAGAFAALPGRILLALGFRALGSHLPAKSRERAQALGSLLSSRTSQLAVFVLFAVSPLPSNSLFEAAGLARLRLTPLAIAFLAGRLVTYTLYLFLASKVQSGLAAILAQGVTSWQAVVLGVAGIAGVFAVVGIDWPRVIDRFDRKRKPRAQTA